MTSSSVRGERFTAPTPCDRCGTRERYVKRNRCCHCWCAQRRNGTTDAQRRQAAIRKSQTLRGKPADEGMRKFTKRLRALWPDFNVPEDTLFNRFLTMRLVTDE